jgi:hypothetical protein
MEFARPGLADRKKKLGEQPGQKLPENWAPAAVLPGKCRR